MFFFSVSFAFSGDSFLVSSYPPSNPDLPPIDKSSSRLLGNLLALIGSITYAWYEVWYKLNVALADPDTPVKAGEVEGESIEAEEEEVNALLSNEDQLNSAEPPSSILSITSSDPTILHPSSSTYLLYSNFITTLIGLSTFLIFWIPIPLLHYLGWEIFELPPVGTRLAIFGMILSGVIFNASFMILLSIWGPVVAVSIFSRKELNLIEVNLRIQELTKKFFFFQYLFRTSFLLPHQSNSTF